MNKHLKNKRPLNGFSINEVVYQTLRSVGNATCDYDKDLAELIEKNLTEKMGFIQK